MKILKPNELKAIDDISKKLGVPSLWLKQLLYFESKYNPLALNKKSGARGLIQFMPKTAKNMGFIDSINLVASFPTFESQLRGPVLHYLSKYKPFKSEVAFYMSVFYPVAMNWNIRRQFPKIVREYNPGINTPLDYYNFVIGKNKSYIVIYGIIIGGMIYLYNKFRKE